MDASECILILILVSTLFLNGDYFIFPLASAQFTPIKSVNGDVKDLRIKLTGGIKGLLNNKEIDEWRKSHERFCEHWWNDNRIDYSLGNCLADQYFVADTIFIDQIYAPAENSLIIKFEITWKIRWFSTLCENDAIFEDLSTFPFEYDYDRQIYCDTYMSDVFGSTVDDCSRVFPGDKPFPTNIPTSTLTEKPSRQLIYKPTAIPILEPIQPTKIPSLQPIQATEIPTLEPIQPTKIPTLEPIQPTEIPTLEPIQPTRIPTLRPDMIVIYNQIEVSNIQMMMYGVNQMDKKASDAWKEVTNAHVESYWNTRNNDGVVRNLKVYLTEIIQQIYPQDDKSVLISYESEFSFVTENSPINSFRIISDPFLTADEKMTYMASLRKSSGAFESLMDVSQLMNVATEDTSALAAIKHSLLPSSPSPISSTILNPTWNPTITLTTFGRTRFPTHTPSYVQTTLPTTPLQTLQAHQLLMTLDGLTTMNAIMQLAWEEQTNIFVKNMFINPNDGIFVVDVVTRLISFNVIRDVTDAEAEDVEAMSSSPDGKRELQNNRLNILYFQRIFYRTSKNDKVTIHELMLAPFNSDHGKLQYLQNLQFQRGSDALQKVLAVSDVVIISEEGTLEIDKVDNLSMSLGKIEEQLDENGSQLWSWMVQEFTSTYYDNAIQANQYYPVSDVEVKVEITSQVIMDNVLTITYDETLMYRSTFFNHNNPYSIAVSPFETESRRAAFAESLVRINMPYFRSVTYVYPVIILAPIVQPSLQTNIPTSSVVTETNQVEAMLEDGSTVVVSNAFVIVAAIFFGMFVASLIKILITINQEKSRNKESYWIKDVIRKQQRDALTRGGGTTSTNTFVSGQSGHNSGDNDEGHDTVVSRRGSSQYSVSSHGTLPNPLNDKNVLWEDIFDEEGEVNVENHIKHRGATGGTRGKSIPLVSILHKSHSLSSKFDSNDNVSKYERISQEYNPRRVPIL